MSHGRGGRETDTSLRRQSEHSGVIQKVLQIDNGLQNGLEIIRVRKPETTLLPHGVNVECETPFSELKPGHFGASEAAEEPPIGVAEGQLGGPGPIGLGLHGLGLEHEHDNL